MTITLDFLRYSDADFSDPIGVVNIKKGSIKVKIAGTGSWTQLQNGDLIHSNSVVLSNHGSTAKYMLKNGTVINHKESSMLIIKIDSSSENNVEDKDVQINVVDGSFVFLSDGLSSKSKIKMKDATLEMDKKEKSSIKINKQEDNMKVYVISGKLDVATEDSTVEVKAGEFIASSPETQTDEIKKEKIPDSLQKQLQEEADDVKAEVSNYQFLKERSIKYIYRRLFKLLSF